MSLGEKLRVLRTRKQESLQDVADAVNASKAHIWDLERGHSKNPSIELLTKLADHFNVPVASLIGENPAAPDEPPEMVAMYRNLKKLSDRDLEWIRTIIKSMTKPNADKDSGD